MPENLKKYPLLNVIQGADVLDHIYGCTFNGIEISEKNYFETFPKICNASICEYLH